MSEKGKILTPIVAYGILIVGSCPQPSVVRPVVVLDPTSFEGMIRIGMAAALEIGRKGVRLVPSSVGVRVRQTRLTSIGSGKPAGHVIGRPIFHHHNDDVIYADSSGAGSDLLSGSILGPRTRPT